MSGATLSARRKVLRHVALSQLALRKVGTPARTPRHEQVAVVGRRRLGRLLQRVRVEAVGHQVGRRQAPMHHRRRAALPMQMEEEQQLGQAAHLLGRAVLVELVVDARAVHARHQHREAALRVLEQAVLVGERATRQIHHVAAAHQSATSARQRPHARAVVRERARVDVEAHQHLGRTLVETQDHLHVAPRILAQNGHRVRGAQHIRALLRAAAVLPHHLVDVLQLGGRRRRVQPVHEQIHVAAGRLTRHVVRIQARHHCAARRHHVLPVHARELSLRVVLPVLRELRRRAHRRLAHRHRPRLHRIQPRHRRRLAAQRLRHKARLLLAHVHQMQIALLQHRAVRLLRKHAPVLLLLAVRQQHRVASTAQ
mmetsp:Transcript_38775/g.97690  ORF Transcript_38775/g.97690 Transcript_38775/m.97690 type:complete len:369 (+) Transcript_38775:3729-4835(+)